MASAHGVASLFLPPPQRRLKGNGVPNHVFGTYPITKGSVAYNIYAQAPAQGYANAAEIPVLPYVLDITIPKNPILNDQPTCIGDLLIGVAKDTGAAWHVEFAMVGDPASPIAVDPNAALPTDLCWGHPYATQYHYHGCADQVARLKS